MGSRIAAMTSRSFLGFEPDETSFKRAASRIEPLGGVVHQQTVETVDPPPADLLCAFEVLEHIEDDRAALEKWSSYIVPGGHLVISVPAHQHRFGPADEYSGHMRRYSPSALEDLVRALHFGDITSTLYGLPLGYALEAVRNRVDGRHLAQAKASGVSIAELTAASGRGFQFESRSWRSALTTTAVSPFKYLQRVWPDGVGLVLVARKP
jgi:hypothetical protein